MRRRIWLASGAAVASLFLFMGVAGAHTFRSGDVATVPASETVDNSFWAAGRTIVIAGTVNGDVHCGGHGLIVSGTVKGDVVCAAQTITITGTVEGSAHLLAQTINLNGTVGRNLTAAAQTLNFDPKSTVNGDVSIAGRDANLNGTIGRDLALAVSSANLSGVVGRDIKASTEHFRLASTAKVGGNLEYTSTNNVELASGASVGGQTIKHTPKQKATHWGALIGFAGWAILYLTLALLITMLVLVALFPKAIHTTAQQAVRRPWVALLTGFIASLVIPVIIVVLLLTLVGIPLGLILLLWWLLVCALSGVVSAYFTGWLVWRRQTNPILTMLVGSLILLVLYFIPFLGILAVMAALWLGTGMIILELKSRTPSPAYKTK